MNETSKNINLSLKDEKDAKQVNYDYYKKMTRYLIKQLSDIKGRLLNFNLDDDNYFDCFSIIENDFSAITEKVDYLTDGIDDFSESLSRKINSVKSYYLKVQSSLIGIKVNVMSKKIKQLENNFEKTTIDNIEKTEEMTNSQYFNIAAVFLGISLVSSMVAGVQYMNENNILLYFLSIGWVSLVVIGFCSILIRRFNLKSFALILLIVVYSFIFLFFSNAYFKSLRKNENVEKNDNCDCIISNSSNEEYVYTPSDITN